MFDLILARGWQAIHSLLHSPTRFQRTRATNMSVSHLTYALVSKSEACAEGGRRAPNACKRIADAIDDYVRDYVHNEFVRRNLDRVGSAAAASLGEDEVAALGDHLPALSGELIEESHRFPYVYVGLFGAVVAFVAFYVGRRTRNDAYYSV